MDFGPIQASVGGVLLLLAVAVMWLAQRLKQKNRQLRRALAELQTRRKELAAAASIEPVTVATAQPDASVEKLQSLAPNSADATVDAFLWEHLGDAFLWKHLAGPPRSMLTALPVQQENRAPSGMCTRAELSEILQRAEPFSGLVVLVGIDETRSRRQGVDITDFIEELLNPGDFACPHDEDAFLIVCPGLRGPDAQRRLNEISERLWSFQLRGNGAFSVLFSWGGIGAEDEPLSRAVASATDRMQQTKRSRVLLFSRKAG